jgi:hypothetical protein
MKKAESVTEMGKGRGVQGPAGRSLGAQGSWKDMGHPVKDWEWSPECV